MKLTLPLLLIGAAPVVPVGKFQTWMPSSGAPLQFRSGGLTIHAEALPCEQKPKADHDCGADGYDGHAIVTLDAPGENKVKLATDPAGAYVRIAVVHFDKRNARLGLIIESQYGGSGGAMTAQLVAPADGGYKILPLGNHDVPYLEGQIADFPRDLSGDGRLDLRLEDGAFDSAFGCNACTPRPPRVFAVIDGAIVDESSDSSLRGVFEADMARLAPHCMSTSRYRNGTCAAYVADGARAGKFEAAWKVMLRHYEHGRDVWRSCTTSPRRSQCYDNFPASLKAFLKQTGYRPT